MSEQNAPATGDETQAAPAAPEGIPAEAWGALGDPGKAALTAERQARAAAEQAAQALQAQLDEIAKANLSDLERAKADAEDARKAAATATTEALRYRLAAEYGISSEDAALFLTGTDEASMKAQAERLAARSTAPATPKPDRSQGGTGTPAKPPSNGEKFADFFHSKTQS